MRSLTHIVNELSRKRRDHREDKNETIDEMCCQNKETLNLMEFLFIEVKLLRRFLESLVHHYYQENRMIKKK